MNKGLPVLLSMTILSGIALSSSLAIAEDNEVIDTVELTVPVACTMGGVGTTSHNASINPGTYSGASGSEYEAGIGKTTLTTFCNDNNGFSVYAIGFTGDLYEGETHTKLIGQNTNLTISTKVYTSGDTDSNWSMKVTKVDNPVSGDPITYNPDNMSIQNSFNSWHTVPDVYTKVAQYNSNTTDPATTDTTLGAKLETTYATYISSAQAADTYTGQVKYTMVHPYDRRAPEAPYFQVFYTGRPVSTEPGQENPVKIRMSELPESGTYNLLGTEDGLYDKLTPGKLYGGYYKNIVPWFEDFSYSNSTTTYDGANIIWPLENAQYTDAANFTPENEATYYVKEVPDGYLQNFYHYYYHTGTGNLTYVYLISAIDDRNYSDAHIKLDGEYTQRKVVKKITFGGEPYTPGSMFGNKGVVDNDVVRVLYCGDLSVLMAAGVYNAIPMWVTLDGYEVTGKTLRTYTVAAPIHTGITYVETDVGITINTWEEP